VRILLDECLPVRLAGLLAGHDVRTVSMIGWSGVKNGELLRRAAQEFDVFMTIDQRLARDASDISGLSIITLRAPSSRLDVLQALVPAILAALDDLTPGERLRIEA
jgi:hypothetical protein